MWRILLLGFTLFLAPAAVGAATPALAPVFTVSMVLQRGVPVPVWGKGVRNGSGTESRWREVNEVRVSRSLP